MPLLVLSLPSGVCLILGIQSILDSISRGTPCMPLFDDLHWLGTWSSGSPSVAADAATSGSFTSLRLSQRRALALLSGCPVPCGAPAHLGCRLLGGETVSPSLKAGWWEPRVGTRDSSCSGSGLGRRPWPELVTEQI